MRNVGIGKGQFSVVSGEEWVRSGKEEKSRVLIMYLDLMFWLSLTTYNHSVID